MQIALSSSETLNRAREPGRVTCSYEAVRAAGAAIDAAAPAALFLI